MQIQTLNGAWEVINGNRESAALPAHVPGCVHLDLLAAGQLDDPNYRDNEAKQMWVGRTDWIYRRTFDVPAELLGHERVLLRCHGLDTIAHISINDRPVGDTDNMYRLWEFDVKSFLSPGTNRIAIRFDAPTTYAERMDAEKGKLAGWVEPMRINSAAWIRKEPCNYGWDWGPVLVTAGIWRDLELVSFDIARLSDVLVLQNHDAPGEVRLTIQGSIEQTGNLAAKVDIGVTFEGQLVSAGEVATQNGIFEANLTVKNPHLWWVNGLGEQPLYTVNVRLLDERGEQLDTWTRRIGLRVLRLDRHADEWGESFQFSINGRAFFAKGANWIPADPLAARVTREHLEANIHAAVDANMNMLRVWGGGIYEEDMFYDLCDEYGIAIWQDFMFACGTYPTFDDDFMSNVTAEAHDNVRRIRHHACLALWCGNNEIEQGMPSEEWQASMSWDDYSKLFDDHLFILVQELDPQRDYWPGSPHVSLGPRTDWMSQASGDSHLWTVWHGKQPFEWYRTRADRFCSEFGFQSFPEPRVVEEFTLPEDRNITSYIMEYHQRSAIGNGTIITYLLEWFRLPESFESLVWLSQILQGLAMQYAVENWRRGMPRTMGTLYWQLNDCWPGPSWASLDYHGHWKALQYFARRFYTPVLISGVEDTTTGTVAIHVTSDAPGPVTATARWIVTTADGATLTSGQTPVEIKPNESRLVETIALSAALAHYGKRNLLVWLSLIVGGETASENLVLFMRPKHLELPPAQIDMQVTRNDNAFDVTLTAEHPALFVWLEADGGTVDISDNFFHLPAKQPRTLRLNMPCVSSAEAVAGKLKVRSLVDTYGS